MLNVTKNHAKTLLQSGRVVYHSVPAYDGREAQLLRYVRHQLKAQSRALLSNQMERLQAWGDRRFTVPSGIEETSSGLALSFPALDLRPLFIKFHEGIKDHRLLFDLCFQLADLHDFLFQQGLPQYAQGMDLIFVDGSNQLRVLGVEAWEPVCFDSRSSQDWGEVMNVLPYLSPEHQIDDHELDPIGVEMYALGVAFFRLASGRYPLRGKTVAEWCHQHMAVKPPLLCDIDLSFPTSLSCVIEKMLSKDSGQRYRSFETLKADLIEGGKTLDMSQSQAMDFMSNELSNVTLNASTLYGRNAEVALLNGLCDQILSGKPAVLTIAGYSGIGKSSLAQLAGKAVSSSGGLMIAGKFDQTGSSQPYAPLVDAFNEWVNLVLGTEETSMQRYVSVLQAALSPNGRVLTEIIPDLELLIGTQPLIPDIQPGETKNRFQMVFRTFLGVLCHEQPLVLFLDDLQWADPASIHLLHHLLSHLTQAKLLVILAYRDNEVGASHPLQYALRKFPELGLQHHHLSLSNLGFDEVNQLIAERLGVSTLFCEPLSSYIYEKTGGNPFFTLQLLQSLLDDQTVFFNSSLKQWCWDEQQLAQCQYAANVVDLMVARIHKLPGEVQRLLTLASCIGNSFDLDSLRSVRVDETSDMIADLGQAVDAGLLTQVAKREGSVSTYRFIHDRVQQAAYSLKVGTRKNALHLQIGLKLWQEAEPARLEERLFEIVNQVNRGKALIDDAQRRHELAQLNLRACRRAKHTNAYQNALKYARTGCELLDESAWQESYDLAFNLHLESLRLLYLLNETQQAEPLCQVLLQKVMSQYDRLMVREAMIMFLNKHGKHKETIALAMQTIQEMEIQILDQIPASAPPVSLHGPNAACLTFEDIFNLPDIQDRKVERVMHLLLSVLPTAYLSDAKLFSQLVFTLLDLSLRYGNSEASAGTYATFGMALRRAHPELIRESYQYSRMGLKLLDRYQIQTTGTIVYGAHNIMIRHWCEPLHNSWHSLLETSQISIDLGNYEHGYYNISFATSYDFYMGHPLLEVQDRAKHAMRLTDALQTEVNWGFVPAWSGVVASFIDGPATDYYISSPYFDEEEFPPVMLEKGQHNGVFIMWMGKCLLAYYFGDSAPVKRFLQQAQDYSATFDLMVDGWQQTFYQALILLDLQGADDPDAVNFGLANDCLSQLQYWQSHCPDNFANKVALVEAELARVTGKTTQAMQMYEVAIEKAEQQHFLHEAGLACQLAARFYQTQGVGRLVELYASKAIQYFSLWGADALCQRCAQTFNILSPLPSNLGPAKSILAGSSAVHKLVENKELIGLSVLDSHAVVQAYQVLASEVVLQPLLEKFLAIAVRNAGAQRGCLVLAQEDQLDFTNAYEFPAGQHDAASNSEIKITKSIALYVARTKRDVLLEDAAFDPLYREDPYVLEAKLRSVLCFALIHKTKFIGILYLENNLMPGSFTPTRVEILRLLMAQAVISIDNANLYRNMESLIEARTQALQEAQHQLVHTGKMAAIGELASGVAHELNQPLAFIRGGAQLELMNFDLGDPLNLDSVKETLEQVVMGTDRMMKIVNHLREFARTSESDTPVPVNVHESIENALLMVSQQFRNQNIQIKCNYVADVLCVQGYADKLEQVLINLLCNARDALQDTPSPQVEIETRWSANDKAVDSLEVLVRDNGPGMSAELQEEIFKPYFTTKSAGEGTGLGLPLSERIIEEHGGKITVSSQEGKGSCFVIQMPSLLK